MSLYTAFFVALNDYFHTYFKTKHSTAFQKIPKIISYAYIALTFIYSSDIKTSVKPLFVNRNENVTSFSIPQNSDESKIIYLRSKSIASN